MDGLGLIYTICTCRFFLGGGVFMGLEEREVVLQRLLVSLVKERRGGKLDFCSEEEGKVRLFVTTIPTKIKNNIFQPKKGRGYIEKSKTKTKPISCPG